MLLTEACWMARTFAYCLNTSYFFKNFSSHFLYLDARDHPGPSASGPGVHLLWFCICNTLQRGDKHRHMWRVTATKNPACLWRVYLNQPKSWVNSASGSRSVRTSHLGFCFIIWTGYGAVNEHTESTKKALAGKLNPKFHSCRDVHWRRNLKQNLKYTSSLLLRSLIWLVFGRLDEEGAVRGPLICSSRVKEEWLWAFGLDMRQKFYISKYVVSDDLISLLQVKRIF